MSEEEPRIPNPSIIRIQPFPIVRNVSKVNLTVAELEFGVKAVFSVDSLTENGVVYKRDIVVMEGEDYQQWNNDDDYAINFVLGKLGYVRA